MNNTHKFSPVRPTVAKKRFGPKRGEKHHNAKVTEEMVYEILENTPIMRFPTNAYFERKFKVTKACISHIRSRDHWSWVPDPRVKCKNCEGKGFIVI